MIAYKKLVIVDTPYGKVVMSPTRGTAWTLKNGYFYLSCDETVLSQVPEEYSKMTWFMTGRKMPPGIYSCKSPDYEELKQYGGSLAEVSIGGIVVEHERGYRSSEACLLRIISKDAIPAQSLISAFISCDENDMRTMGDKASIFLVNYILHQDPSTIEGFWMLDWRGIQCSLEEKFRRAFYPDAERTLHYGHW